VSAVSWPTAHCLPTPARALEGFITPTITAAAADAGRPRPRIIALVSVAVTNDVDAARAAADSLALYDSIPSYQEVLAREGLSSSVELAVIGTAEAVTRRLKTSWTPTRPTWRCYRC
jgi:alkanesulfonate monooxygenase SsuD/methylene tetrahydromethanopterin reductase-like flavin-dependent oxidoreductase (luciferase family)